MDCGRLICKHLTWLQALAIFDIVRGNFSNANVFSSTFDNYTEALMEKLPELNLPVFTEEIGDTWIYGAPCELLLTPACSLVLSGASDKVGVFHPRLLQDSSVFAGSQDSSLLKAICETCLATGIPIRFMHQL